jgi:hypothetical protein
VAIGLHPCLAAAADLCIGATTARAESVDLAIVLAADVSRSVDDEFKLQRQGYAAAVSDPRMLRAPRTTRGPRCSVNDEHPYDEAHQNEYCCTCGNGSPLPVCVRLVALHHRKDRDDEVGDKLEPKR